MVDVPVNAKVLKWARAQRRLDLLEAAKATGLDEKTIRDFEDNRILPTLGQLEKIATGYEISFASLLMPEPLPENTKPHIVDFRIHKGGAAPEWGHELSVAADVVNEQLSGLAELIDADRDLAGAILLPELKLTDNSETKADEERKRLGISVQQQMNLETPAKAFSFWRYVIESQGVIVYLMNLGDWQDCRGYCVFDSPNVPAIIINNDDATPGARLYTLIHEYCHLLLRMAGLSDQNRTNHVERFCNNFAAYFLMPRAAFIVAARSLQRVPSDYWTDGALRKLGGLFGASMSAAALHLEQTGLVKPGLFERKQAEWKHKKPGNPFSQMSYAERQVSRLGVRHMEIVMSALQRGSLNQIEAYDLTEVNPKHYDDVRAQLKQRQELYGRT